MSDHVTPEYIEQLKIRDERWRVIDLGIEIRASLENNRPLAMLMASLRREAMAAVQEFATADCGNVPLIQGLQSRIYRCIYAMDTFASIMEQSVHAERTVVAEDMAERERDY